MISIDSENLLIYHSKIIKATGGSDGVRDIGLVQSALGRAETSFDGNYLYDTDTDKIAAITYSLINNHAFVDGNKRIGVAVMLLLLRLNYINIKYIQKELIELGLNIAQRKLEIKDIVEWIKDHKI